MASKSEIEWTDATWSPITGCSMKSPGCKYCYAARYAATRARDHWAREGLARMVYETDERGRRVGRGVFNGKVRFNEPWLYQPLQWTKPRRIFTCAHADLFHEHVGWDWIDRIWAVMGLASHHQFQVLTKREEGLYNYLVSACGTALAQSAEARVGRTAMRIAAERGENVNAPGWDYWWDWPLPNVWVGISAEDQEHFDARWARLQLVPAAKRFLSLEPLLGPIVLHGPLSKLDWVIVGGESGPGARPMNPKWVISLYEQCKQQGIPFFLKQWGSWYPVIDNGLLHPGKPVAPPLPHRAIHRWDRETTSYLIGRARAGRRLYGREHSEMPA